MHRKSIVITLAALLVAASASAFGAAGDKANVKGMIIARNGETLLVETANAKITVVLTDGTTTKDDRGLFGLEKQKMSSVVLIPGLKVDVDGTSDGQGRVEAKTITVDGDDLETAEMVQAGLHPTAEQVKANMRVIETNQQNIAGNKAQVSANKGNIESNQRNIEANQQNIADNQRQVEFNTRDIEDHTNRFIALGEYDVKGEATVKFDAGSSRISAADQEELKKLAQTSAGLAGYIIEVMGYADSTGSAAMNTKLSEDRAKAVITYLIQQGNIPVRRIVAPGAMGEYGSLAPNETSSGRAQNRRVEVKILVNKGIAGT